MSQSLTELDAKIVEALLIDGRASWQRIAHTLGVNERTVARRGNELLDSGDVWVGAIKVPMPGFVVALRCGQGQSRMTSTALSQHHASSWVHVTAGDYDVVAEINIPNDNESNFLLEELPAFAGVREINSYPVVEYLRQARIWNLGILTEQERRAMWEAAPNSRHNYVGTEDPLSARDAALLTALRSDGRLPYEELGRRAGVSDVTAKRRVDALRRNGTIAIRTFFNPKALGLTTEALMWLEVPPRHIPEVVEGVRRAEHIKYAARLTGPWAFMLMTNIPGRMALDDVLPDEPWVEHISRYNVSIALRTDKLSTVRTQPDSVPSPTAAGSR
ncbi:Lrp/AsnC family transcriptional regulator [Nesterenkonia alba]|uniref:Lrp/AsnC family transcriptional regulator n=1 Tax=Nesterenkonia alba TaxID=515814 RepID=UPI0003B5F5EA|nr:Lrp/AsnC family transcriptional regulator [Nesterenkonia alba]